MADFRWNKRRRLGAKLFADGDLTDAEIAEKCGVSRQAVWLWKQTAEFMEVVNRHLEAYHQQVRRRGLASRERRVAALNDRWTRMHRIIEARADDPQMAEIPGGNTGLLVKTVKTRQVGELISETTIEAELDSVLLKELREHEKQAAQELGQWVDKQDTTSTTTIGLSPQLKLGLDKVYPVSDGNSNPGHD